MQYNILWAKLEIEIVSKSKCRRISILGCADFVPSRIDRVSAGGGNSSALSVAQFESFRDVLRKASSWVHHQDRVRVTNVQSIDYKVKHDYGRFSKLSVYRINK
jgi:hypothetical protein